MASQVGTRACYFAQGLRATSALPGWIGTERPWRWGEVNRMHKAAPSRRAEGDLGHEDRKPTNAWHHTPSGN